MKTLFQGRQRVAALVAAALGGVGFCLDAAAQVDAAACSASSGRTMAPVVELYTSEGCSSCPPADQWLSRFRADPAVVALAFHVDYWDRLGWKDRFGSPAYTARQAQQQQSNGARFSYTPQVVVDGRDLTDWPSLAVPLAARSGNAPVELTLAREGQRVTASVTPLAGAPRQLAAYWAVTEQGHVSAVRAGENEGATLKHDYVVRTYRPVATWATSAGAPASFAYDLPTAADPAHPRAVNLVVVNAETGRPVQAVKLGC